jgi:hypothetical protein
VGEILVTKSDKNVWRRFCVVGGGDSVWVAGKFYFLQHTDTQLKLLRDTGHKVDTNLVGDLVGISCG